MKRTLATLLAATFLTASLPALADRPHHRDGWRGPPPHAARHHHHHHHHHRDNALAWGLGGLVLGGVIASTWPKPVVVAPPMVVAPPPPRPVRVWYWCESGQAYYPTVPYCPEGWRTVPGY